MELTPEERSRIYEEEKARLEVEAREKRHVEREKTKRGLMGCLLSSVALMVIFAAIGAVVGKKGGPSSKRMTESHEKQQQAEVARKATAEKAAQEERARLEALRPKIPEIYEKAMALAKAGNYSEAIPLFEELTKLDANFKNVPTQLKTARDEVAESQVADLLKDANRLSKSDNCRDMLQAQSKFNEVVRLIPGKERTVAPSLQKVREEMLACSKGSGPLQMSIKITKRRPVTLYVWIKKMSDSIRHANPNHFTLITKSREIHSCSSDSFEHSKPFPAVQLQPGTEASGIVIFDTYDAPRTLIYQELLGARVSRDFP